MSVPGAGWGAVRAKYPQMMATRVVRGTRSVEVPVEGAAVVADGCRMRCSRRGRGGCRS